MIFEEFLDIVKSEEPTDITSDLERTSTSGFEQGVNRSSKITLSDGEQYLLKLGKDEHISKWRLIPKNEQYKREVAAYKLDEMLGWNLVPETKLVVIDGNLGSAQFWLNNVVHIKNIDEFVQNLDEDLSWKIGLTDFIQGENDRHSGNILWDKKYNRSWLIDNGYSFPYISSKPNPQSLILSRFALKIQNKEIPEKYLKDIRDLYFRLTEKNEIQELLDEPSYLEFITRIEELLTRKKAFLENYRVIPKLEKIPPSVNLEQLDIYSWVDEVLNKAKFKIEGKLPYGTKNIGYRIVYDTYNSLRDTIDSYLKTMTSSLNENVIVEGLIQTLEKWQTDINKKIQVPIEELFKRGYAAGIIDSNVSKDMSLIDRLALEFITKHPEGILSTLKTFGEDLRIKFKEIISAHFADEKKALSIFTLAEDLNKQVASEKWKLMRIARTETNKIVNCGRLLGWSKDPYRFEYEYSWQDSSDDRTKEISKWRRINSPYTFVEIAFLWENQKQMLDDHWENDIYNNRCTSSRKPIHQEFRGNRFLGQEDKFEKVLDLGFEY